MTTELTVYDRILDPMAAVKQLGFSIASSKMFGVEAPSQGEIFALECLVRRTPPLMLAEKYHVIFNRLSMRAEAMLARFEELGGKHRLIERTPSRAAIELTRDGQTPKVFSLTWEEATREPFVYEPAKGQKEADIIDLLEKGTPPPIKTKYRTPRSRMQMLWARVVSDAVNAVDPRVKSGTYTPEEISDFPENAGKTLSVVEGDEIEGELVEEVGSETVSPSTRQPAQADLANGGTLGMCSAEQSSCIKELFGELGVSPENRSEILAKRSAATVRNLTSTQANELIAALQKKLANRSGTEAKSGMSDAEIASQVRELLKQVEQMHPGTVAAFKAKMAERSIGKIDELRREDLLSLLSALKAPHDIEKYFGVAIWEASPKN